MSDPSDRPRTAACLWFTRLPLRELVEVIRARHFPRMDRRIEVRFAVQEGLVEIHDGAPVVLSFHEVLNQSGTPAEVFGALAKRALAQIDRKDALRAPFAALCPEEPFADAWTSQFLGGCTRRREDDGIEVTRAWQATWLRPRPLTPLLRIRLAEADAALRRFARA